MFLASGVDQVTLFISPIMDIWKLLYVSMWSML